ncbi:MAG: class I SAM-dependent methyltransferase [Planctomycetota bacterium]
MNFDRIAPYFRPLEWLLFQDSMQRARECHLSKVRDARSILVLGEGDGRFVEALLRASSPRGRHIEILDSSRRMLGLAKKRLQRSGIDPKAIAGIRWRPEDLRGADLGQQRFDLVVTPFVLDCFSAESLEKIVPSIASSLQPGGHWLHIDFREAKTPRWARWRSRAWLFALYAFFRRTVDLEARELHDLEPLMRGYSLKRQSNTRFRGGLIEASLWESFTPGQASGKITQGETT